MGSLRPDAVLRGPDRAVVIDAKYKRHLELLRRTGWRAAGDELRESHRADLHQVLAYAALQPERRVDAVLAYPWQHDRAHEPPRGVARLAVGDRRVRVVLAGLPFGFDGPDQRDRTIAAWRAMLAAGEI
jgi:5-methylcytosine-specific restriction endonuclease McrBC regulatory subunit McrC